MINREKIYTRKIITEKTDICNNIICIGCLNEISIFKECVCGYTVEQKKKIFGEELWTAFEKERTKR
jgi:hypothetical protein